MNSEIKNSYIIKDYQFVKNIEKIPNSMDLLELGTELNFNESQSAIRHAACQICNNIATNPKMCEECEVLYCGNCAASLLLNCKNNKEVVCKNCPELLVLKNLSKSLQRIIDDFHLYCPSLSEKCSQPILYKDLVDHLDTCKYWIGFSKCLGCGLIGRTHVIEEHILICPFTYFKCGICSNVIKRKDLEIHRENCAKVTLPCEMCKTLKTKVDALEEKLVKKLNSLESLIDFQQKSILKNIEFYLILNIYSIIEFNQSNQRITELENSNTLLEAQLANKKFKAKILTKIEDLSEQQTREINLINSIKLISKKLFLKLGKINLIANDGLYSKETEFNKNLDLNINLNSSLNELNIESKKIYSSANKKLKNGIN